MIDYDFRVVTDGSGHPDGFGGWATFAETASKNVQMFRFGCIAGTSVDRAELTAICEGLQIVYEMFMKMKDDLKLGRRPIVDLRSDRENLVCSIQGLYKRSNSADLWARFGFYERFFQVNAHHVARESDIPELQMCDLHASTGRIIAKNYHQTQQLFDVVVPKVHNYGVRLGTGT